jgi:hypothetical protein
MSSKTWYFDKLCQMKMPSWTKGRVALVGDAGYCASPAAGRGGSLAIDGAAALGKAFEKCAGNYELAFKEYNESFRPFTVWLSVFLLPNGVTAQVCPRFAFSDSISAREGSSRTLMHYQIEVENGGMIPNNKQAVGKMRIRASEVNKKQPGDPEKLAAAIVQIARSENPPLHLPLGKDSLSAYQVKTANFAKDIEAGTRLLSGLTMMMLKSPHDS